MAVVCTRCEVPKELDQFTKNKGKPNGINSWCKRCYQVHASDERENNPKQARGRCRRWREQNLDSERERTRGVRKTKDQTLRARFGITLAQYEAMLVAQGGKCAICQTTEPGGRWGTFCVDHNHATGAIRELLCSGCNTAIGMVRENTETLTAAIHYLRKHRGN